MSLTFRAFSEYPYQFRPFCSSKPTFSGQKRRKSLGATSGECGGGGNACILKCCICLRYGGLNKVGHWHAADTRKKTTNYGDVWPVSKHITVPSTVHCLSLLQAMFKNHSFMIPVFRSSSEWPLYLHTCTHTVYTHGTQVWNIIRFNVMLYLLTYSIEQSPSWEANWFCS